MYRILKIFLLIFIILILITCSSTPIPQLSENSVPLDFFGVVHAGKKIDEYPLLDEMGAVWLLQTFYWDGIEKEKGIFDYSRNDVFVNTAKENGKKVIAVMGYGASWTGDRKKYISKENIPLFLNFLEITVERYKGKVDAWQIWNEPNILFWRGTNKEYYELTRLSAQRIRETDPDAYIIGGGFWRAPRGFLKGMHKAGALENLNALSFHPYETSPERAVKVHENFVEIMTEINFTGEIWITEVGYPTGGWSPINVSMKNFPSYVIKTMAGYAAREARALLWYQFADPYNEGEYPDKINSEDYFGLTYPNRTKKNGGWAYGLCACFLPGSQFKKGLPERENIPSSIVSFCFINEKAHNTLIIWNDRNSAQKIKIILGSSFAIHNISTGEITALPDESILDITNVPVFITWEGSSIPGISRN